jgi:DNA-binding GntR family transcriptional regulator
MLSLVESSESDPKAPRSQTSLAYARIRADILGGRLAPDERLKITDLASALDVSPGAIREALSRLVPEQLVVSRDQKGFVVAPISIEDLLDITDLRCEIESIALRRSVARGDAGWEAGILAAAHQLRRTPGRMSEVDRSIAPQWVDRHAAFHVALVAACGSRRLLALHSQLYQQSERYRGLSAHIETGRDVETEHQALVDAALDRNADLLVGLSVTHFRKTTSLIVDAARRGSAAQTA